MSVPPPVPLVPPPPTRAGSNLFSVLGVAHFAMAALTVMGALAGIVAISAGMAGMADLRENPGQGASLHVLAWGLLLGGGLYILLGIAFAGLQAYAGYCLLHRQRRKLCFFVAGMSCGLIAIHPCGLPNLLLGAATLGALMHGESRELFDGTPVERTGG